MKHNQMKHNAALLACDILTILKEEIDALEIVEELAYGTLLYHNNSQQTYSARIQVRFFNQELDSFVSSIPFSCLCKPTHDIRERSKVTALEIFNVVKEFERSRSWVNKEENKKKMMMDLINKIEEIKDSIKDQQYIELCNISKKIFEQ